LLPPACHCKAVLRILALQVPAVWNQGCSAGPPAHHGWCLVQAPRWGVSRAGGAVWGSQIGPISPALSPRVASSPPPRIGPRRPGRGGGGCRVLCVVGQNPHPLAFGLVLVSACQPPRALGQELQLQLHCASHLLVMQADCVRDDTMTPKVTNKSKPRTSSHHPLNLPVLPFGKETNFQIMQRLRSKCAAVGSDKRKMYAETASGHWNG
jgi:hypothetical protein